MTEVHIRTVRGRDGRKLASLTVGDKNQQTWWQCISFCMGVLCYFNEGQHFINKSSEVPEVQCIPKPSKFAILLKIGKI